MDQHCRKTYDYDLPEELIAQTPLASRSDSRLLVAGRRGDLGHHSVHELSELLPEESLLIFNNTRVFPSRILTRTATGGRCELFLLEKLTSSRWRCLAKPMKKLRLGQKIGVSPHIDASVVSIDYEGQTPSVEIEFSCCDEQLSTWLEEGGYVPLPPYIRRTSAKPARLSTDTQRYQTVYAEVRGSTAAPTAGLHFDAELLKRLEERGHETSFVTLHVGAGTFLPVKCDDVRAHKMHSEMYLIPSTTLASIERARSGGRKIIAVGTTSLRSLEAFFLDHGGDSRQADELLSTDLFIHPSGADLYQPRVVDALFTNFHQPESTLLMLCAALLGTSRIKEIYKEAIEERYRFFSYGDASLLWLD